MPDEGSSLHEYKSLVLLVDDQPIVGEAVRRALEGESDISLHYCSKAVNALATAATLRPTVILQDLVMPDGDGLDLVQQFRAYEPTAAIPIVVLSTKEDPLIKSRAFAAGANDYIVKLPDRAELIARIRYHSHAHINALQRAEAFRALHESQRQLLEANTALTATNQQLNAFVGMAAHDLRNPLGVILGFAKFLLRDGSQYSPEQAKFLTSIQSSADFMLGLVNDLLDVSQIDSGKLALAMKPTDLAALIEANVATARILALEKSIAITVSTNGLTSDVAIDGRRIEQVLTNLLTNAIKYSHANTQIDVSLRPAERAVVIAIRDHGQGIPAAELDRLFLPFSVTSVRATRGEKSTGLGLTIAKKVVDAHGGRIWVESAEGEGSTFFVSLPTTLM